MSTKGRSVSIAETISGPDKTMPGLTTEKVDANMPMAVASAVVHTPKPDMSIAQQPEIMTLQALFLDQNASIPAPVDNVQVDLRPTSQATHSAPILARHVALQLAEAARVLPDRPVELTLNPEELGRVRLTFNAENGAMVVSVNVERQDTLDLLRRHIETLAQEMRQLGYRDVSFSFSQGSNGRGDATGFSQDGHSHNDPLAGEIGEETQPSGPRAARLNLDLQSGVDIRI